MWNSIYCGVSLILLTCTICDCYRGSFIIPGNRYQSSLYAKKNWGPPSANPALGGVDISSLPKPDETGGITYTVGLTQRAGINWGSDLSFRWVYVLELDQSGEASASGLIQKVTVPVLFQECNRGRDLKYCFYSSIAPLLQGDYIIAFGNDTTIGLDFDAVIDVSNYSI